MSSGRMLDTVENVAAYYAAAGARQPSVAVFLFFAACYGRVLWVAGDGRAALSLSRAAVLGTGRAGRPSEGRTA